MRLISVIRCLLERDRLIADGHAIYDAGKAMGVAQERYRLLCDEALTMSAPTYLGSCLHA